MKKQTSTSFSFDDIFSELTSDCEKLKSLEVEDSLIRKYVDSFHTQQLVFSDLEGNIKFYNRKFLEFVEYSAIEIYKQNISVFYHPDDLVEIKDRIKRRLNGISETYSTRLIKKSGNIAWIEIHGIPAIDTSKKVIGTFAVIIDITQKVQEEDIIKKNKEKLEEEVDKRTRALSIANYHMVSEIKERKLAENALKQSEKRFKDLFLNSPEAIFVEDFDGKILDANDAAAILLGLSREELLGQNAKDFASDSPDFDARQSKITEGKLDNFDSWVKHSSGKTIPIAVKTAIMEYNGELSLLLHARDISSRIEYEKELVLLNKQLDNKVTERTKELEREVQFKTIAQEEIRKQNIFLQQLIDINPNMIFVKNQDGEISSANQAFLDFFCIAREDVLDKKEMDIIGLEDFQIESEKQDEIALLDPNIKYDFSQEVSFKHKKFVSYLKVTKQAIVTDKDRGADIVTVITNLTELKENEKRLQFSESLYRQIARNVPNSAIYVFDKNLVYHLAEGSLVGTISLPKDQIEGKHVLDTGEDESILIERVERYSRILEGHKEKTQVDEYGRSYLINGSPILDENDQIIFGLVVILDVTELKTAQIELKEKNEKLARSNDELEKFAYVASHDLQSPLKTIISFLQLLEQRYTDKIGDDGKEFIQFCIDSSSRMRNLIADLLNYSRINSVPRPFVDTNLNELMFIVTKNLEANINAKKAKIIYENLPSIKTEPYMLTQLLQNLIDNAMKFTKPDKTVEVKITYIDTPKYHQLSVSDNGIGIKEAFKDKIFQIFQRLHNDKEYSGTGIGLAICRKVVNHHKGDIWIESEYGVGTTFHFTIRKNLKNELQEELPAD